MDLLEKLRQQLLTIRAYLDGLPSPAPVPFPPFPHASKIQEWALAIQKQEGGRPWDLNMKNKNPGNLKYTKLTASLGGKKGGSATDGGTFCYFDTYEEGFAALCTFLKWAAQDELQSYYPTMPLSKFTQVYAQPPSNAYVNAVAAALKVTPDTMIQNLL